jgi:hypothetical protein
LIAPSTKFTTINSFPLLLKGRRFLITKCLRMSENSHMARTFKKSIQFLKSWKKT